MPDYEYYEDNEDNSEDECSEESNLLDYNFTPYPLYFLQDDGTKTLYPGKKLYLGIELEVKSRPTYRSDDLGILANNFKEIYLKRDGSLHEDRGFEIVTYPMSPNYTKQFIPKLCKKLEMLSIEGHSAGIGYGMHVHVSRAALSPLHQAKMVVFMSVENIRLLTYVAQRANEEWCEIREKRICRSDIEDAYKYQALNNSKIKTMEFRIFRSNTRSERVLKNIEFVLAVIEYTRTCSIRELTTDPFLKWLKNNKKSYPNLFRFLAENDGSSDYTGRYADVLNYRVAKRASNA